MPILNGMTTDYGQDTGAFIVGSMITKGIFAINDVNDPVTAIDLNLGTNGSITFAVGGANDDPGTSDELKLTTVFKGGYDSPVYNFEATGQHAISFSPGDQYSTVYVGDAVFYSDTTHVYLTSFTKKLNILTDEMTLDGSLKTLQNLKVEGQVYTPEVNITRNFIDSSDYSSNLLGFAFRINDQQNLELVKYKHNETHIDTNLCQLVATFGQGHLQHDPNLPFNLYENTSFASLEDYQFKVNDNADGTTESVWKQTPNDANNIHFGGYGNTQQYVGINNLNPQHHLDVFGTVNALTYTDGFLEIKDGCITNAKIIEIRTDNGYGLKFKDLHLTQDGPVDVFWDGHASNLFNIDKIQLSTFENNLSYSDFHTGTKITWFDDSPTNIHLSSFSNDIIDFLGLVEFENIKINSTLTCENGDMNNVSVCNLSVLEVISKDIRSVNLFTSNVYTDFTNTTILQTSNHITDTMTANYASVHTIDASNIAITQQLTANMLDVINKLVAQQVETQVAVIKNTLFTSNLFVADYVKGALIPESDEVYDLGSPEHKWRDLYLSSGTLHIDKMVLSSKSDEFGNSLNIGDGTRLGDFGIETAKMVFPDGTEMQSFTDVINAVNIGETFGDFSDFTLSINHLTNDIESLNGKYIYSIRHNMAEEGKQWKFLNFKDYDVLPILENGTGVDHTKSIVLKIGDTPNNVFLSFVHNNSFVGEEVYLCGTYATNINDLYNVRTLDPYSSKFLRKAKCNFTNFYNNSDTGSLSSGHTIYTTREKPYVQLNNILSIVNKVSASKSYTLECIVYHKSPKYDPKYIVDSMNNQYLISQEIEVRKSQVWESTIDEYGISSFSLKTIHEDYGLFPFIKLVTWENANNKLEFSDVFYTSDMQWGDEIPNKQVIYDRFTSNGWLKELFKITYMYIKYGDIFESLESKDIDDDFLNNIDARFSTAVDTESIIFIQGTSITSRTGQIIDNYTSFCLKKSIFEPYI